MKIDNALLKTEKDVKDYEARVLLLKAHLEQLLLMMPGDREIDERLRLLLAKLKKKQLHAEELKGMLRQKNETIEQLKEILRKKILIIEELEEDEEVPEEEHDERTIVEDSPEKSRVDFKNYYKMKGVDEHFDNHHRIRPSKVRFKRVVEGMYHYGTHKVFGKVVDDKLYLKMGEKGPDLTYDQFLDRYDEEEYGKQLHSNPFVKQEVADKEAKKIVKSAAKITVDEKSRVFSTGGMNCFK